MASPRLSARSLHCYMYQNGSTCYLKARQLLQVARNQPYAVLQH